MNSKSMQNHIDAQVFEKGKDFVAKEAKAVARNAFEGIMDPTILILVTLIGRKLLTFFQKMEEWIL